MSKLLKILLALVTNSNGDCSQEIEAAMEELKKITKSKDVSLEVKAKIIHTQFPVTMHRCESWTVKAANRKKTDSFEI